MSATPIPGPTMDPRAETDQAISGRRPCMLNAPAPDEAETLLSSQAQFVRAFNDKAHR
jgi:hypothetical protein